jgi:iron complex outermembrane receptor protein
MKKADTTPVLFLALMLFLAQPVFGSGSPPEGKGTDPAAAAESVATLAPMVVTAQKRAEDVQDIPASITVIDAHLIEDARIQGMEEISTFTPGLEFRNAGSRRHSISFMRGIKNIHNQEPAMGYYVDGVSYSKSYMFDFPLFDMERVEVLRGPQGPLYGRNSMSGVINVVTAEPSNETQGKISLNLGNYDLAELQGHLKTPIIEDKLLMGFSGLLKQRDGYMENDIQTGEDEGRYTEGGGGRLKLKYLPSDVLDITLGLDGKTYDEGAFALRRTSRNPLVQKGVVEADDKYHYSHDFAGTADTDFWGTYLNVNYALPIGTLTSITGYRDYHVDEFIDSDFSPLDLTRLNYVQEDQNITQEFRLASPETGGPFQWLAGFYYFNNDSENRTTTYYRSAMGGHPQNPFGADTGNRLNVSDGSNEGTAVFGQGTYRFREKFGITLGLRYEYEEAEMKWTQKDSPDNGTPTTQELPFANNDFDTLLPKVSLAWYMTDSHMAYATFAGGHRSGGFNKLAPDGYNAFDEETSWLYEIGTKLGFLNQRLVMNLAGFYMDIEDEQITKFDTGLNTPYNVNAGESHRLGIEAEIRYTPVPGLDFNAGITVLKAEYDSYTDSAQGIDYDGNQVFNVPKLSGNIGAQYRCPLYGQWDFMGRVDVIGFGRRYLDDANEVEEGAYALVNAKVGIEGEHLDVHLWSDNLFDRNYVVFENTFKGLAEDGAPLTVGVSVGYRF